MSKQKKMLSKSPDALDDFEFTDKMQAFRDAPKKNHKYVVECFESVKSYIRENNTNIRGEEK